MKWRRFFICLLALFFLPVHVATGDITLHEIPAFYNFQKLYPKSSNVDERLKLNPIKINMSFYPGAQKLPEGNIVNATVLRGETLYKSLVVENHTFNKTLSAGFRFPNKSSIFSSTNTDISLVPTWFQAGRNTTFSKDGQYLTHELLLKTDIEVSFEDGWIEQNKKWSYLPPTLKRGEIIKTAIAAADSRRLLLEINTPDDIVPGHYPLELFIKNQNKELVVVTINLYVANADLDIHLKDNYKLWIYSPLSLDPQVGRRNSYINGQNNQGSPSYQRKNYQYKVNDIHDKGFNGVFIKDWRPRYVSDALEIIKTAGLRDVIVYGTSYIEKGKEIIKQSLVDVITDAGFTPIFYGYDEPGGNKKLTQQIALNRKIHSMGAKSINAVWWDDISNVRASISKTSEQFDFLTVSLGSHGRTKFLRSLPMKKETDSLPSYLCYWHPHVEIPARNKLYMGYWLWASGLDGVSPHTYYALPHVARFYRNQAGADEKNRGRLSPYNDFSMWDNPTGRFRQHATVYPEKHGVISTLQWEAVADGVTDLILVQQVEALSLTVKSAFTKMKMEALLSQISKDVIANRPARDYIEPMDKWKNQLKQLIIENND